MSWRAANASAERTFGSATRKQIIMFLADKASYDGSGIWCSKGTIQRHTELGETSVKLYHYDRPDRLRRHLADFLTTCNFARCLKTLRGLTPYEYICKIWTSEPDRFIL